MVGQQYTLVDFVAKRAATIWNMMAEEMDWMLARE